jgi:hypothetical protein
VSMVPVPVPSGLSSIPELPKLRESVVNMVRFGDALIPRPGCVETHSGLGSVRGAIDVDGFAHFVMGQRLQRLFPDGTLFDLGELTGEGRVLHDQGFPGAVLVDSAGGGAYVLSKTTFQQILDPDFVQSRDVAYIDGYYVFVPLDGSALFYSDIGDPLSYDAGNFFDAERLPDNNRGVRNFRGDLYVMGTEGTEVFRTTGNVTIPFQRVEGAFIEVGLVSAHIQASGFFAMIGKLRDQDYGVFALGGSSYERISTPAVDFILNDEYTLGELEQAFATRFVHRSIEVICWHLPRHTLAYYGDWAVFETGTVGEDVAPWLVEAILFSRGQYLVATRDGRLGTLGGLDDMGVDFSKGFDTFIRSGRDANIRISSLELDCLTGQQAIDYRVGLNLSDDGRIWGPRLWKPLGSTGNYSQRVQFQYPGGLGLYESFAGIRIRSTEPVTFAIEGMQAVLR